MNSPVFNTHGLELWGGVECTVNRVGDQYFDQLAWSGHAQRIEDLDRFASLGLKILRYPILWERIAPDGIDEADWRWADERLHRLRELDITPIVGFVHHGSGPRYTGLLDPAFADKLAAFAAAFAQRYPWVELFTPVNEPLTTARFSGLYGLWHPHRRDEASFIRILFNECRGVVRAMEAIRAVNPAARLIQTEDLRKVFSTARLAYQADFENERRWLGFDLLMGRVDQHHPLWSYLLESGQREADILWFQEHACPPDVLGLNYYLTSERFLDECLERYPPHTHGGNGRDRYVDAEAVRVRALGLWGPKALLGECWERFRLPMAITEVHNGCTREEQLRWFMYVWQAAADARRAGMDLRAVTAWTLLGAYDWNSLVTQANGHYEPGVFDLSGTQPRPTALAGLLRDLSEGREPRHPLLDSPGWWQRPQRLSFGISVLDASTAEQLKQKRRDRRTAQFGLPRALVIVGARGTLGRAFARICKIRGIPYRLLSRADMDIADADMVAATLGALQPWAVVNAAGYVRVDDAEREPERCFRENAQGPGALAQVCARLGLPLLTFSSDLVFDGEQDRPYHEADPALPLNVYGRSKAEAERLVLAHCPRSLVVRTSAFFGPWDEYNFVTVALRTLAAGQRFRAADDAIVSPTYVPDLVNACLDLLIDGESGIWHLANQGQISWAALARRMAQAAGLDPRRVIACRQDELALPARRPRYSVLSSERGILLPPLDRALERYLAECEVDWQAALAVDTRVSVPAQGTS